MDDVNAIIRRVRFLSKAQQCATVACVITAACLIATPIDVMGVPIGLALFIVSSAIFNSLYKRLGDKLALGHNVHAIGPLLDTMIGGGILLNSGSSLRRPLILLLLRMRAKDAALLNARHHEVLRNLLTFDEWTTYPAAYRLALWVLWWPLTLTRKRLPTSLLSHLGIEVASTELKIAILRALSRIGDSRAQDTVEKLAATAHDLSVRSEASETLIALKEQASRNDAARLLLRSAQPPAAGILLQPVAFTAQDEALLLRPAATDVDIERNDRGHSVQESARH